MENVDTSKELREKIIGWINSKERNFQSGLKLLQESGYKPHVTKRLEKWGAVDHSAKKLLQELRLYLRYTVSQDSSIHDDELDGDQGDPDEKFLSRVEKELQQEYPPIVKQLLSEFSGLYNSRSILHKDLKAKGENNDEKTVAERKHILLVIDSTSRRMDVLWKAFSAYKESEQLPDESLFSEPFDPEKEVSEIEKKKDNPDSYKDIDLPADPVALKKMKDNFRINISKTKNKLEYQDEKKGEKPNPMPEGPKRAELEKRLTWLENQKERIEYKIVEMK